MINDPDGNRTRVTAVKGRCLNRLTTGPLFSSSVAEPFLILSYNFYNCKSFFLILSIFLLKFFTVFYDFLKLIFYSFFENISYVPYSIVLSLIYTAKLRITCFSQHFLRFFYISAQVFRFMTVAPYCDDLSAKLSVPF